MMIKKEKGIIVTQVLVFGGIFLLILSGLLGFILLQLRQSNQKIAWNQSLEIAEAGVEYYKWCLNNEVQDSCQTTRQVYDLSGQLLGTADLTIDESVNCDAVSSRTITSSGRTVSFPSVKRKVRVLYAKESVATFAYLLNDSVWAGADREIRGLYHSNGGIRMDGENQSLVTSAAPDGEWVCTDSFGCDTCPTSSGCSVVSFQCICPGVFTTTNNPREDLFSFPVNRFDFDGITIDLGDIKDITDEYPQQYYWPPSTDLDSRGDGYHIKFLNNGTFEVWLVTSLSRTWGYNNDEGWHYDYYTISGEYRYTNPIAINPNCSLLFVEDDLWIEGEINGKITVASADLINSSGETDVIIAGDINYTALDGSDGLGVIAERSVMIPPNSPESLEMRGIFVAQNGHFGRNHYDNNFRDKLEINGSIISNGREGTQWTSDGQIISGYLERENYNDSNLVYNPPPFISSVSSEFKIVNWEEVQ